MGEYDLKRLEVAIQYINRMVSGRNPVTNRPAPENEVLTNPNVNRCLQFVSEILTEVKSTGGIVGKPARAARVPRAPKPSIAETFPYEILQGYQFRQDQQISYFLKQLAEALPEDASLGVQATMITDWLRENEYLEKTFMKDISKEVTIPTQKGAQIGIYSERAGVFPNEYYRVFYNQQAQLFLIENFRRILTEGSEIREKRRKERKEKKESQKAQEREGTAAPVRGSNDGTAGRSSNYPSAGASRKDYGTGASRKDYGTGASRKDYGTGTSRKDYGGGASRKDYGTGASRKDYGTGASRKDYMAGTANPSAAGAAYGGGSAEEDPAFLSLLSSVPADAPYDAEPGDYSYDIPQEFGDAGGAGGAAGAWNDGFMGMSQEEWESADEGLPW